MGEGGGVWRIVNSLSHSLTPLSRPSLQGHQGINLFRGVGMKPSAPSKHETLNKQTRGIGPMLGQCWASVVKYLTFAGTRDETSA